MNKYRYLTEVQTNNKFFWQFIKTLDKAVKPWWFPRFILNLLYKYNKKALYDFTKGTNIKSFNEDWLNTKIIGKYPKKLERLAQSVCIRTNQTNTLTDVLNFIK